MVPFYWHGLTLIPAWISLILKSNLINVSKRGPIGFNTLGPRQECDHFTDDIFNCIFLNENAWISIKISLKFVPNYQWRTYASLGLNELNRKVLFLVNIVQRLIKSPNASERVLSTETDPDSKVHWANMGPRWATCWSHELCYLGNALMP